MPAGAISFRSRGTREAEDVIGNVFERRFDFKVLDLDTFDFSLDHHPCGPGVSVSRMKFGSEVAVRIDRVEVFMVQMPLAGRNDVVLDGASTLSLSNRMFSVVNPGRSLTQRRHKGCEMTLVRFDERPLARCLAAQIGEPDEATIGRIEFAAGMSTGHPGGSAWTRLMSFVLGELNKGDSVFSSPLSASQTGNLMMSTLLLNQPHNYTRLLQRPPRDTSPRFVRDACDWIDSNAQQPVSVDDIARAVNLSTRSLYSGFKKYRNQTPMDYLKTVRLSRVRDELLSSHRRANITTIAMEWGFTHLSNFAHDYYVKYGELPSQTIRRAR